MLAREVFDAPVSADVPVMAPVSVEGFDEAA